MRKWILFAFFTVIAANLASADDWPQWRGPDRSDVSAETGLLKSWPQGGPKCLWLNKEVGLGYSGFSVVGDTLFTMGIRGDTENLIALKVKDGTQKWATPIGPMLKNAYGSGPRGTPTFDKNRLYALSGPGILVCANAADGAILWKVAMSDFGGKMPNWGYAESVLVDGEQVVCTPGGNKGAIVALDKNSGKPIWQSKDFTEGAQYSSIVPTEQGGMHQYVQLTMKKLVGLDAKTGNVMWTSDWPGKTAVIPTPIVHGDEVFITSGYGVGCKLVKLESGKKAVAIYDNTEMTDHHGGVVLIGDYLYGYSDKSGWTCLEFKTGKQVWADKKKLEKGCLTAAEGMLYLQGEKTGQIVLIEASPDGWKEHGRFTLQPQTTERSPKGGIWTHPVIANGKLYLRDQELVPCFDISAK